MAKLIIVHGIADIASNTIMASKNCIAVSVAIGISSGRGAIVITSNTTVRTNPTMKKKIAAAAKSIAIRLVSTYFTQNRKKG